MASDLIRKADVQKILKALYDNRQYSDVASTLFVAMENIHDLPTVDAAPVVHGEWIVQNSSYTKFKCSACGSEYHERRWDYCPMCAAKMDGGDKR